jgi:hypothetical protein
MIAGVVPVRLRLSRIQSASHETNGLPVVVTRKTIFGNPFESFGERPAVALYEIWVRGRVTDYEIRQGYRQETADLLINVRRNVLEPLPKLRCKNLASFCCLPAPGARDLCHAALHWSWPNG